MTLSGIALVLLLAQTPAPPPPQAPPASIEGVVTKTGTGEPLSKVTVTLTPGPASDALVQSPTVLLRTGAGTTRPSMTTAADGKFLFENLRPGTYTLTAALGGYTPAAYGQRSPNGRGMSITLKSGQKMQNASLSMTPEGTITGRIVDANGDPLSRALVEAMKVVYQEKGRSLVSIQAVPTDDKGDYRLFWLPPGKYYIRATASDYLVNTPGLISRVYGDASNIIRIVQGVNVTARTSSNGEMIEEAAVPVYYPAALNTATAAPIDVRAGEIVSGIDIATSTARVYRIRGATVDAAGKPAATSTINLLALNGPFTSQTIPISQTSNDASFEIAGVLPGAYNLITYGIDTSGKPATGFAQVDIAGANVNNVIIATMTSTTISGRIVIEGAVSNIQDAARTGSILVRLDPQTPGLSTNSAPMTADGTFRLADVIPGDYRIHVAVPTGMVPKSILYDGKDVLTTGLHAGGSGGTIEIVLTADAGRIEGNVVAEKEQRVVNATVVLMPNAALRQQTNLYQTVQSNAEGHFIIDNISPGGYRLLAFDQIEDRAWFDADYMRDFENRGKEMLIREGARENIDIPVISQ